MSKTAKKFFDAVQLPKVIAYVERDSQGMVSIYFEFSHDCSQAALSTLSNSQFLILYRFPLLFHAVLVHYSLCSLIITSFEPFPSNHI